MEFNGLQFYEIEKLENEQEKTEITRVNINLGEHIC